MPARTADLLIAHVHFHEYPDKTRLTNKHDRSQSDYPSTSLSNCSCPQCEWKINFKLTLFLFPDFTLVVDYKNITRLT